VATKTPDPGLTAVNDEISPVPLEARPITVFELVHVKVELGKELVKFVDGISSPLQTLILPGTITVGAALTVILNAEGVPGQPLTVGVTVMTALIAADPLFVAVKGAIFPVPLPGKPIEGLEFVHANVPPGGVLVKFRAGTTAAGHTVISAGTETVGIEYTVMVYVEGVPTQVFTVGTTDIDPEMFEELVFVAVNGCMLPVPPDARPIAVLELVHEKVPPDGILTKLEVGTVPLLQTKMLEGTVTVGVGFTVMVYVVGEPTQPFMVGYTDIVAVMGVDPGFEAVKAGRLPVPLDVRPMAVFELVHVKVAPAGLLEKFEAATEP